MAKKNIVILGFMTFALFVGAGNIFFPHFRYCKNRVYTQHVPDADS